MGLFWDLLQQSQISDQKDRTSSVEERIAFLESELHSLQGLVHMLIQKLEERFGQDIDGDGKVG